MQHNALATLLQQAPRLKNILQRQSSAAGFVLNTETQWIAPEDLEVRVSERSILFFSFALGRKDGMKVGRKKDMKEEWEEGRKEKMKDKWKEE